ncbi:hypothetical protein CDD81_3446 [Ophiocordyceps australis]|uniref:Uncharacterized protein n=1 Tax=Ophiocordyceps australis TaxID=1399860 RepID=A0A2C5XJN2_9HYPO|nr:hypothetical protein CDD81_3446 [Ophiocordyceps australis]
MSSQAGWCRDSFRAWVSQQDLLRFCSDGVCDAWWHEMDMGHWVRAAPVIRTYRDEPQTEEEWARYNAEMQRAYAMTAREWRVMCARAVVEAELCVVSFDFFFFQVETELCVVSFDFLSSS